MWGYYKQTNKTSKGQPDFVYISMQAGIEMKSTKSTNKKIGGRKESWKANKLRKKAKYVHPDEGFWRVSDNSALDRQHDIVNVTHIIIICFTSRARTHYAKRGIEIQLMLDATHRQYKK